MPRFILPKYFFFSHFPAKIEKKSPELLVRALFKYPEAFVHANVKVGSPR